MSGKDIHILFKVANFIYSDACLPYSLLPLDKLLLLALAKHAGPKGIYPAIPTLAKELHTDDRHIRRRLTHLKRLKLIHIDSRPGLNSYYSFLFLSTDPGRTDPGYTLSNPGSTDPDTPGLQTPHPGSTDPTISINNQYRESVQRESAKKRAPLPENFLPNEANQRLLKEVSSKTGLTDGQLLAKFKNLQKSKQNLSADWNASLETFLINERPMGLGINKFQQEGPKAPRMLEWHEIKAQRQQQEAEERARRKAAEEEEKKVKEVVPHKSFKELKEEYNRKNGVLTDEISRTATDHQGRRRNC
jgi:hypothetical protein